MMSYFVEFTSILGIAYSIYFLVLRRTKLFDFTRIFLIGALAMSLISPFVKFESTIAPSLVKIEEIVDFSPISTMQENVSDLKTSVIDTDESFGFSMNVLWLVYALITSLFFIKFIKNLYSLLLLAGTSTSKKRGLNLVLIQKRATPFSFFNFLFVDSEKDKEGKISEFVILHEEVHAKQLHSLDILFVELIKCAFWFNPFVWLFKKAITENHEYQVDECILKKEADGSAYRYEIIDSVMNKKSPSLVSGFSYLQIKNRINMMAKPNSRPYTRISKIMIVVVLFSTALTLNSFKLNQAEPFVVVLDAGHGGKDPGFRKGEIMEKEINLKISRKLEAYSKKGEVEIILSRSIDEFVSLKGRVDFINSKKADLLLSIHSEGLGTLGHQVGVHGFYPRLSPASDAVDTISMEYANVLIKNGLGELKQGKGTQPANFVVLQSLNCPGVLLSLGNMENEVESEILQNDKSLNKIANDIYKKLNILRKNR